MAKINKKGRANKGPAFIQIFNYVFDSPAYRALKPGPRALMTELIRRHNGSNNGHIGLGLREAALALNMVDRQAVAGYFEQLKEYGFIRLVKDSGFNMKSAEERTAREWELTMYQRNGTPPCKTFLYWKAPEKSRGGKTGPARTENPSLTPFPRAKPLQLGPEKLAVGCTG